jgi:antitoxin ParD1/3/4
METLTITLPEDCVAFLREQAEARGSSVDAYIDALTREARTRAAKKRLEALLIEGLESGPAEPWTPQDMEDIEREVMERLEAERRAQ